MPLHPDSSQDTDEAAMRLRRGRPVDPSQQLDAQLHLAETRQRFAGADPEPVAFGKWNIERKLGRGGMGAVYLARDRTLGRRVALKVLPGGDDRRDRLREARALAASSHPNVVQIFSVDDSHPPALILEMEYIEGETLRAWQTRSGRRWQAIVEAYAAAGDGLAAIHRGALIHRDIKPDNILVSAADEVKVVDLGLAVAPQRLTESPTEPASAPLALRLTAEGVLVGTLGYIAPEVLAGLEATPASDQFSLASALFEALFGCLPFQGLTPEAHAAAIRDGRLALPDNHTIPRWLVDLLRRALAFDPAARYPSIDALVRALRRGLSRRRRLGVIALLLGTLGATALGAWTLKPPPPDPCIHAGDPMRDLWSGDRRDALARPASSDAPPHLRRATDLLLGTIDRRAETWIDTRTRLCAAERRTPSLDALAHDLNLRQRACLDQIRRDLDLLVAALHPAPPRDRDRSRQLLEIAHAIEALPNCDDRRVLAQWPLDAHDDPAIPEQLSRSLALELAGDFPAAERLARELAERTEILPFRRAQALYRLGHILGAQHRFAAAFAVFDEARNTAWLSGHDALMCQAAAHQAKLAANVALDPQTSSRDLGFAEVCAQRIQMDAALLKAELLEARGLLAQAAGLEEARAWHRQALDHRRDLLGDDHPDIAKSLHNLANTLARIDPADPEARRLYAEALELRERLLDPDHPDIAAVLLDQSETLDDLAARASLTRALAIYDRTPDAYQALRANIHIDLAQHLLPADPQAAAVHLTHARELQERAYDLPPHHPDRANLLHAEGALALRRGELRRARTLLTRAIAVYRRHDPDSDDAIAALAFWIEAVAGQPDPVSIAIEARDFSEPLRAHLSTLAPADTGKFAWYAADALAHEGSPLEAAAYYRLALNAYEALDDQANVAELRWLLARALLDANGDREEARRLAQSALLYHRKHGPRGHITTINRWLKELSGLQAPASHE